MKPTRCAAFVLLIIGCLLVSSVACTSLEDVSALLFVSALDKASVCALALHCLETDQAEKTRQILEQCLISSLQRANELGRSVQSLELHVPNMRESIRKAEAYLAQRGLDPGSARELGALINGLPVSGAVGIN